MWHPDKEKAGSRRKDRHNVAGVTALASDPRRSKRSPTPLDEDEDRLLPRSIIKSHIDRPHYIPGVSDINRQAIIRPSTSASSSVASSSMESIASNNTEVSRVLGKVNLTNLLSRLGSNGILSAKSDVNKWKAGNKKVATVSVKKTTPTDVVSGKSTTPAAPKRIAHVPVAVKQATVTTSSLFADLVFAPQSPALKKKKRVAATPAPAAPSSSPLDLLSSIQKDMDARAAEETRRYAAASPQPSVVPPLKRRAVESPPLARKQPGRRGVRWKDEHGGSLEACKVFELDPLERAWKHRMNQMPAMDDDEGEERGVQPQPARRMSVDEVERAQHAGPRLSDNERRHVFRSVMNVARATRSPVAPIESPLPLPLPPPPPPPAMSQSHVDSMHDGNVVEEEMNLTEETGKEPEDKRMAWEKVLSMVTNTKVNEPRLREKPVTLLSIADVMGRRADPVVREEEEKEHEQKEQLSGFDEAAEMQCPQRTVDAESEVVVNEGESEPACEEGTESTRETATHSDKCDVEAAELGPARQEKVVGRSDAASEQELETSAKEGEEEGKEEEDTGQRPPHNNPHGSESAHGSPSRQTHNVDVVVCVTAARYTSGVVASPRLESDGQFELGTADFRSKNTGGFEPTASEATGAGAGAEEQESSEKTEEKSLEVEDKTTQGKGEPSYESSVLVGKEKENIKKKKKMDDTVDPMEYGELSVDSVEADALLFQPPQHEDQKMKKGERGDFAQTVPVVEGAVAPTTPSVSPVVVQMDGFVSSETTLTLGVPGSASGRRPMQCRLCRNHRVQAARHRSEACPYSECECTRCSDIRRHRENMNQQYQARRSSLARFNSLLDSSVESTSRSSAQLFGDSPPPLAPAPPGEALSALLRTVSPSRALAPSASSAPAPIVGATAHIKDAACLRVGPPPSAHLDRPPPSLPLWGVGEVGERAPPPQPDVLGSNGRGEDEASAPTSDTLPSQETNARLQHAVKREAGGEKGGECVVVGARRARLASPAPPATLPAPPPTPTPAPSPAPREIKTEPRPHSAALVPRSHSGTPHSSHDSSGTSTPWDHLGEYQREMLIQWEPERAFGSMGGMIGYQEEVNRSNSVEPRAAQGVFNNAFTAPPAAIPFTVNVQTHPPPPLLFVPPPASATPSYPFTQGFYPQLPGFPPFVQQPQQGGHGVGGQPPPPRGQQQHMQQAHPQMQPVPPMTLPQVQQMQYLMNAIAYPNPFSMRFDQDMPPQMGGQWPRQGRAVFAQPRPSTETPPDPSPPESSVPPPGRPPHTPHPHPHTPYNNRRL